MPLEIRAGISDEAKEKLDLIQKYMGCDRPNAVEQAILTADAKKCGIDWHTRRLRDIKTAPAPAEATT